MGDLIFGATVAAIIMFVGPTLTDSALTFAIVGAVVAAVGHLLLG